MIAGPENRGDADVRRTTNGGLGSGAETQPATSYGGGLLASTSIYYFADTGDMRRPVVR